MQGLEGVEVEEQNLNCHLKINQIESFNVGVGHSAQGEKVCAVML